jgi:hypothetical protein
MPRQNLQSCPLQPGILAESDGFRQCKSTPTKPVVAEDHDCLSGLCGRWKGISALRSSESFQLVKLAFFRTNHSVLCVTIRLVEAGSLPND